MSFLVISKDRAFRGQFIKDDLVQKLTEKGFDAMSVVNEVLKKGKLECGTHRIMYVR